MADDGEDKGGDALWQQAMAGVAPLKKGAERPAVSLPKRPASTQAIRRIERPLTEDIAPKTQAEPVALDRKRQRKISAGKQSIDTVLDLHGMTQEQAFIALKKGLLHAHAAGKKTMIVITGKGGVRFSQSSDTPVSYRKRSDFALQEGVLRQRLPEWLKGPDCQPFVESFGPAAPHHGGDGAFYVLVRKRKGQIS